MYIYIAGPLFNDSERRLNYYVDKVVRQHGFKTYLPQRDGGEAAKEMNKVNSDNSLTQIDKKDRLFSLRQDIFIEDIKAIDNSNVMIAVLDGRVPDEGTCVEIGYAYAKAIPIIGLKTDERSFIQGLDNIMIEHTCSTIVHSIDELRQCLTLL